MSMEFTGAGDPARSLALLWRADAPTGRRTGMDVDTIVTAAVALADADGLAALSMRKLAQRLGVGAMSLYTYVPGKAELLDCMIDEVLGELVRPGHATGGWRSALETIARDNRDCHLRHPWLAQVGTGRPPLGPNVSAKYEYELGAVDGLGLDDVEMDATLALVVGFAQGAAREEIAARAVIHGTGLTDDEWWRRSAPVLERFLDPGRYPVATRVGTAAGTAHDAAGDPTHAFEFGLARILDGIATLVGSREGDRDERDEGTPR